jgi:hypothetical protein
MVVSLASSKLALAVGRLEAWLDTVRHPAGGYGGPVVHWWRDSLLYCGPGFDWRYEGIIEGYLALHRASAGHHWLEKAKRAGDDLIDAQLPGGTFRHSAFELNPGTAGTPHEAAADIGLLALAAELRAAGDADWSTYAATARRNLEDFYIAQLWDADARLFRDDPAHLSFVPNKAATLAEALFLLSDASGDESWQAVYARPVLDAIVRHQVTGAGPLRGAIAQSSSGGSPIEKYFPYYIARCVPALLHGSRRFGEDTYLEAALAAGAFLTRWREPDGAFPQVIYSNGRVNRYPRWSAGVGDLLRVLELLQPHGLTLDLEPTREWLLRGQLENGAFKSAAGFSSQVSQRTPPDVPDMRDCLPVAGWNDKAFRYLAGVAIPGAIDGVNVRPLCVPCTHRGSPAVLKQDKWALELHQNDTLVLRWPTGADWAEIGQPVL